MSFIPHILGGAVKTVGLHHAGEGIEHVLDRPNVPPPPLTPNPNDAANQAQSQTDQMRMRRGLLANLYGGTLNQQPTVGKTTLGT